jgi:hypothetical protein
MFVEGKTEVNTLFDQEKKVENKLVQKLPKTTIANGKIIDVRQGVEDLLKNSKGSEITINTGVGDSQENVSSIKVISEHNVKFFLRISGSETIGNLKTHLENCPEWKSIYPSSVQYELRINFPPKIFQNT